MDYKPIIDFIRSLYPNRDSIPLHEPYFGGNEKKYVRDCIDSTFVSSVGKYVDRFEEMIRDFTGAKYAIATVNGTAALHVALKLAGVQQGDLVITQPLTFIATCNAISYCGADPVFIDIDRDTLGLSPKSLEAWLEENSVIQDGVCYLKQVHELHELHVFNKSQQTNGERQKVTTQYANPKEFNHLPSKIIESQFVKIREIGGLKRISACVPMHTFGHSCRIDKIVEICKKFHIPVVEDSAESIGSYFKGQHTGTFGKLGILSFNGNKTITTGGGGMILTDDDVLGPLAKHITTTAKKPHPWEFEHDMIGFNYRMPNINAALGCAQMEMLPILLNGKRRIADKYRNWFSSFEDFRFVTEPADSVSNFWLNAIILERTQQRDQFLEQTNKQKIQTRPAWTLMNELNLFEKSMSTELYNAAEISSRLVNIPSSYINV